MTGLSDVLAPHLSNGTLVGAVGLVARGEDVEVAAVGSLDATGGAPMQRDTLFRIASVTKPITAAATMLLVDDGRLEPASAIAEWLPELAHPRVVRTPASAVDDTIPARRAITVEDLLTFRCGYGFPSDFSYPAVLMLASELLQGPPQPLKVVAPNEWMSRLGRIPLLSQPGEQFYYNTAADILGVLISRVTGRPFDEFLAERIFAPLGMTDTSFFAPREKRNRFATAYRPTENGVEQIDAPDGQWSSAPAFASGAGGLVSTVDDLWRFARMLLADGRAADRELLSAVSVRRMSTNHLTPNQRAEATLFLEGQGWGFCGSVDVDRTDEWNVPGRYGWVGGSGTAWHITPSTGLATILLTQTELTSPTTPQYMHDFWRYAQSPVVE